MVLASATTDTRRHFGEAALPTPAGLVLIYPALDMNIGNWMTDEQMELIRDPRTRKTNRGVLRRMNSAYRGLAPKSPHHSDDSDDGDSSPKKRASPPPATATTTTTTDAPAPATRPTPAPLRTRIATPSLIAYVSDRVLSPEMMRAMIILYIGPHHRPDFSTEYLLSPVLAPDALLARFPRTYFLTGERDPLVDDTVIMAGRLRRAQGHRARVHVELVGGISHGFVQFASVFPEAWRYIHQVGAWYEECFAAADADADVHPDTHPYAYGHAHGRQRHHHRTLTGSSADEDRPLEMSIGARRGRGGARGGGGVENGKPEHGLARGHPTSRSARSLVSLASEDDLLGRRMRGLTGGLLGTGVGVGGRDV